MSPEAPTFDSGDILTRLVHPAFSNRRFLNIFTQSVTALNEHNRATFTTPFPKAPSRWLSHYQFTPHPIAFTAKGDVDGGLGLPEYAPFDGIIVTAAPQGIPLTLVEQLRPGGRMVLPIGERDEQVLVRVTRTTEGYEHEMLERVSFVPLLGGMA